MTGVQDVPGGDLQGVVLGARHRAAGSHLVAAGDPAPLRGVPLECGSDAAAAQARVDSEGLDVALGQRPAVAQYRRPAGLGADHLDQVTQEASAPGAVKGAEHMRFQRTRDTGGQVAVLGQHPGGQGEHEPEVRSSRLDVPDLHRQQPVQGVTFIHPYIMASGVPVSEGACTAADDRV
jgi:hypothetical protein